MLCSKQANKTHTTTFEIIHFKMFILSFNTHFYHYITIVMSLNNYWPKTDVGTV